MAEVDSDYRIEYSPKNDGDAATPKRTSVIEIWRQREKSAIAGSKTSGTPNTAVIRKKSFSGSPGYNHNEEKKEHTLEEANHVRSKTPTTKTYSSPIPTRQHIVVSPSTPSGKANRVLKTPRPQIRNDEPTLSGRPVTPDAPDGTSSPAFGDLRSKWATFEAKKIQAREDFVIASQKPDTSELTVKTQEKNSSSRIPDHSESDIDEYILRLREDSIVGEEQKSSNSFPPQQPALDSTGRMNHPRRAKAGWSKPRPSPKVATKMYVKDRMKTGTAGPSAESPSRVGRLSQKKQLLDKVRRRNKSAAGRPENGSTPIENTYDEGQIPAFKAMTSNSHGQRPAEESPSPECIPGGTPKAYGTGDDGYISMEPVFLNSEEPFDCHTSPRGSGQPLARSMANNTHASTVVTRASDALRGRPPSRRPDCSTHNQSLNLATFTEDEMMFLEEEQEERRTFTSRPSHPGGRFRPVSPSSVDDTVSQSTGSHMVSTITGFSEANTRQRRMLPPAIVTDEFVIESASNVEAFQTTLKSLSLHELASDISEEAGNVLKGVDLKKISNDWNQGIAAASRSLTAATHSLNKFVGTNEPRKKVSTPQGNREPSPIEEEVAIEVEYVEDDE
jgi:hypothetical protein